VNVTATEGAAVIMVVDDTPANVRLLGGILRTQGFQVAECGSGAEALATAAAHPPDLILLDIMMPQMDGYEVCERLKADERLAPIPVIFLSSLGEVRDKVRAFGAGGVDYITKPFQIDEILVRVETHLQIRRLQRELEEKNRTLSARNERLRELEDLRDGLVHMIVHDLRNPLTAISSFAYLLQTAESSALSEKGRGYIGLITKSADFLIEMSSAVLDVSKMEAGRMALDLTECDLGAIVREAVSRLEALKGERSISLALPDGPVPVRGDPQLLTRLVQNLVGNALKFVHAATGRIEVGLHAGEGRVRCTVRDNGPGIRPEHLEKVFDKYWQASARKQGVSHSSGLGLTFCKMVAEAHGGSIGVESEFGAGSAFWFELPREGPP
jgi:signal transduction histidine kinase